MIMNVGNADRTVRVLVGFIILALGFYYGTYWGLLGLFPLFTGIVGTCPVYSALGCSTKSEASHKPGATR